MSILGLVASERKSTPLGYCPATQLPAGLPVGCERQQYQVVTLFCNNESNLSC